MSWRRLGDLWAEWSDDHPAIVLGRGPQPTPEPPPVAAEPAPVPRPVAMDPAERRARLVGLVARLEADPDDKDAAEALRKLLDG